MKLGTAKTVITPPFPIRMSGYATRTTPFKGVKEDIFLRIHLHEQGEQTLYFIYADILWWGSDFVKEAHEKIVNSFQINKNHLFFIASHNHSGPPTSNNFTPSLETFSPEYKDFLQDTLVETLKKAMDNVEEVTTHLHVGKETLSVFRRVVQDGQVLMRPNYDVPVDQQVTILSYRRKDGSLKGSMIHYPCHANLSAENYIQPDYPGVALGLLDNEHPNSVSIFLQGCTGDVRPNSVLGKLFVSQNYDGVVSFANQFHKTCSYLLKSGGKVVSPILKTRRKNVPLPLEDLLTTEEILEKNQSATGVEKEWAEKVLDKGNRNYETLEISYIDYGDIINMFTFNSEVSQYYAQYGKEKDSRTIVLAYTNGMIGYISTEEQINQGGYEPVDSALYFALAGKYSPSIEGLIHRAMDEIKG